MAGNMFLKIGDVAGESEETGYEEWIEVMSWSWGASQLGSSALGTGAATANVNFQDFSFSMKFGKATPELLLRCCNGTHFGEATFVMTKATGDGGQEKYLELVFTDVMISSYQTGGSMNDIPVESISFNFTQFTQEYFAQDEGGALASAGMTGWNVKTNVSAA